MGVIEPYQVCQTCGGDYVSCLGHIPHIVLSNRAVNIEYPDTVVKFLNKVCHNCSPVLQSSECQTCGTQSKPVKLSKPRFYYIEDIRISTIAVR